MAQELITISARIPKGLYESMDEIVAERDYASRTELLREMIRAEVMRNIRAMKGALKGKVEFSGDMGGLRRKMWQGALKAAGGDTKKASRMLDAQEKKALRGLKL